MHKLAVYSNAFNLRFPSGLHFGNALVYLNSANALQITAKK